MSRRKQPEYIKGTATHRRTEGDYLSVLLNTVTLEDWGEVVANTLQAAKGGDAQARSWLAQYLVGKPASDAPSPLTVVVSQLAGNDALVEKLAKPHIDRALYPVLHQEDVTEDGLKALVAEELASKLPQDAADKRPGNLADDFVWLDGVKATT